MFYIKFFGLCIAVRGCVTMECLMDMLATEQHSLQPTIYTRTSYSSFQKVDGK